MHTLRTTTSSIPPTNKISSGTISFPVGVSTAQIVVPIFRDSVWEQALATHEKFAVVLGSSIDALIDSTRAISYVTITDTDRSNYTLGWCLSDAPTLAPTDIPSHIPTPVPTSDPTSAPTPLPTLSPSLTLLPSSSPTLLPSVTPEPTPGTFEPTFVPLPEPTPPPSLPPSPLPTLTPTPSPTARPTLPPSSHPTLPPTAAPTGRPTPLPSAGPTALPLPAPSKSPLPAPSGVPTASPVPKPTATPTPEPTAAPTPLPTALFIGVIVEARSVVALSGDFASADEFDANQRTIFKKALVASLPSIDSPNDVTINSVTLSTSSRRRLLASGLEIDYTLKYKIADTTLSGAAVTAQLANELTAAFTDDGSGSGAAFSAAMTTAAAEVGVSAVGTLDEAATIAAIESGIEVVVTVSTAAPSSVPTVDGASGGSVGSSASFLEANGTLMIVAGAVLGVVSAFIGFLLFGRLRRSRRRSSKVGPSPEELVVAAASKSSLRAERRPSADKNPPAAKRKKAASVSPESLVESAAWPVFLAGLDGVRIEPSGSGGGGVGEDNDDASSARAAFVEMARGASSVCVGDFEYW